MSISLFTHEGREDPDQSFPLVGAHLLPGFRMVVLAVRGVLESDSINGAKWMTGIALLIY